MQIFFCRLVTFISLINTAYANECATIQKQQHYSINQIFFSIGSDFEIVSNRQKLGKVIERVLSWGKTFEVLNEKGQLVAKARQQVFTYGVKIDVYDCQNKIIGSMQENIWKSFWKITTMYTLLDGNGQTVGQSRKFDGFGTDIIFYDASKRMNARLTRPYFNPLTDRWSFTLSDDSPLDSRILFFAAAYKTSADDARRKAD